MKITFQLTVAGCHLGIPKGKKLFVLQVPIIFGLIVIVGFIGNALVVVVVAANQQVGYLKYNLFGLEMGLLHLRMKFISTDAKHNQLAHHQPGAGRFIIYRLLCSLYEILIFF